MAELANTPSSNEKIQTTSVESTKPRGTLWRLITILASVVILILTVVILAYWFIVLRPQVEPQLNQNQTQSNEAKEGGGQQVTVETELDTSNWNTSKESGLGIEFKYPGDWSVKVNKDPSINLSTENQDSWNLNEYKEIIITSPDYTLSKTGAEEGEELKSGSRILIIPYRNNLNFSTHDEIELVEPGPRDFDKKIKLDGQDARRIDYTLNAAFFLTEIYTVREGKAYLIIRSYLESERSTHEETFKGILSTLRFTK